MNKYLYYTISKDSTNVNEIYEAFEKVVCSKAILSRAKSGYTNNIITMNGNDYISVAKKIKESKYKVPIASYRDFKKSELSNIYSNYCSYKKDLLTDTFKEQPISKEEFFKQNNTNNRKEYFKYLDSISRQYPIDLSVLFKGLSNDKIIDYINKKVNSNSNHKNIGWFYANENAYSKYIKSSQGIIFVIDGNIKTEETILIPNLESDFFDTQMQLELANMVERRYTNLVGELQIKDEIKLNNIKYVIVDKALDLKRVKQILENNHISLRVKQK